MGFHHFADEETESQADFLQGYSLMGGDKESCPVGLMLESMPQTNEGSLALWPSHVPHSESIQDTAKEHADSVEGWKLSCAPVSVLRRSFFVAS